jgi:hypothetical protein
MFRQDIFGSQPQAGTPIHRVCSLLAVDNEIWKLRVENEKPSSVTKTKNAKLHVHAMYTNSPTSAVLAA